MFFELPKYYSEYPISGYNEIAKWVVLIISVIDFFFVFLLPNIVNKKK